MQKRTGTRTRGLAALSNLQKPVVTQDRRDKIDREEGGRSLMPAFGPVSRKDLIHCLRSLGFEGPFSGGKHSFMLKGNLTLTIPNPHKGGIGRELLARILRQAEISRREWEGLD
jgi:predicted RNA binding protein YcfA (HicA-like mRNA interferase family)